VNVDRTAYYTYQDIARGLKVCVRTVARRLKDWPKWRDGNIVRITGFVLAEYLKAHEGASKPDKVPRTRRPSVRLSRTAI
jgi:hypothetical protein